MSQEKNNTRFGVILGIIVLAAASRFISPFNFSPIGAIALFGAAHFTKKMWAFIVPLASLWVSSLILDNVFYSQYYDGFQWFSNPFVYVGFALMAVMGLALLKKVNVATVFGSWLEMPHLYSRDFTGLMASYTAGLAFVQNTLIGNLVYSALLFGSFELMTRSYPQLAEVKA